MKGRVLGMDLGLKRTGLAVSDELRLTTRALDNWTPGSRAYDVQRVLDLCDELNIAVVVIGYPLLPRSGEEGPMGRRARGFCEALQSAFSEKQSPVVVCLRDESYSSKQAAVRLYESGLSQKKRRSSLDGEAARILVEDYLAMNS